MKAVCSSSRAVLQGRLKKLGFDSERWHLRAWLGRAASGGAGGKTAVLSEPKSPADCAIQGRISSLLGDFEKAGPLLDRAAAWLPEEAAVRAWRGELKFLRGEDGAAEELDLAVRLDPAYPWSYVYRAPVRIKGGDLAGAARDVDAFEKLAPGSAAACALKAILEAQSGRRDSAAAWLDRALLQGRQGWVYALRGTMRAGWNELAAARRDMDRALRTEEAPWVYLERAGVSRRLGEFWKAFDDLKAVSAALPHHAEPHLRAADIHLDQAQYVRAVERYSRALRMAPADASIHQRRARAYFVQGKLAEAQKDIETACRLSPGDAGLRQERLQLSIVRGFHEQAWRALETEPLPAGGKDFWKGYILCRRKRFAAAEKSFGRAAAAAGDERLREKARFYRWVARILKEGPAPAPAREKELRLIGVGYRHPYQISAGALRSLGACDAIYSNLSDSQVSDFLGLFPVQTKVIVFRGLASQARASARTVMHGFGRHRRIAMATRGQPVIYGLLAHQLVLECRRRKIPCRVPASVSIMDTIPALAPDRGDGGLGLQVRDARSLERLDPRLPLVVYLPLGAPLASLERALARSYPARHGCLLLPGAGEHEYAARELPLSGLKAALAESDPACTLFVPALP